MVHTLTQTSLYILFTMPYPLGLPSMFWASSKYETLISVYSNCTPVPIPWPIHIAVAWADGIQGAAYYAKITLSIMGNWKH